MARILLVDDDPDVRRLVELTLSDEHEVLTAASWSEAFPKFGQSIDLFLVDVHLPGFTGDQIVKLIRSRHDEGRVLLFSAMDPGDMRRMAKDCGADGAVAKTLDGEQLKRSLTRHLLGRRRRASR